jgi:SRSO17 transposase
VVRGFVAEHLGGQPLVVAALDESGQEKTGQGTAGVKRQYMGCAGRIANGVNTVYCSYATPGGHALVGARIYVPADQMDDPARRAALGIDAQIEFKTKPQLAVDMLTDMVADHTMPPWAAGDEVYGRAGEEVMFTQESVAAAVKLPHRLLYRADMCQLSDVHQFPLVNSTLAQSVDTRERGCTSRRR